MSGPVPYWSDGRVSLYLGDCPPAPHPAPAGNSWARKTAAMEEAR